MIGFCCVLCRSGGRATSVRAIVQPANEPDAEPQVASAELARARPKSVRPLAACKLALTSVMLIWIFYATTVQMIWILFPARRCPPRR